MEAFENLLGRVSESIGFSRSHAIAYNVIYRAMRAAIIILSSFTAEAARHSGQSTFWTPTTTSALALTVAILASLEAWLKPGKVYREHFRFNDLYIAAETNLHLIGAGDRGKLEKFAKDLDSLDKQYRSAIQE